MVMLLVIAAVVLALMAVLAMMVKGCFCDCFGPFSREDPYDKPLDPEDVRRCLQKVRQNQAAREMAREPLVATIPPPMVDASYSAPYPSAPQMNYRPPSPPPAYSDIDKVVSPLPNTQI
uniref:Secreted protein n=1 Tax=Caenorhabditis japonica TaxID=281687 RepID=A0A8R1DP64_CAEJA